MADMMSQMGDLGALALLWPVAAIAGAIAAKMEKGACGTFGRFHYLLYSVGGTGALYVLATQITPGLGPDGLFNAMLFLAAVGGAYHGNIAARRVRNIGWNVWSAMIVFVPFVNVVFWFLLVIKPTGRKKGGSAPQTAAPAQT